MVYRTVECPVCRAAVGAVCRWGPLGARHEWSHGLRREEAARKAAADAIAAQRKKEAANERRQATRRRNKAMGK